MGSSNGNGNGGGINSGGKGVKPGDHYRVELVAAHPDNVSPLINRWHAEGWELVHVHSTVVERSAIDATPTTALYCILERRRAPVEVVVRGRDADVEIVGPGESDDGRPRARLRAARFVQDMAYEHATGYASGPPPGESPESISEPPLNVGEAADGRNCP